MVGAIWNEIFKMGDEVKAQYGAKSDAYKVIHELDDRIQRVYDQKNALTREVIGVPLDGPDGNLLKNVKGLKVVRDDEGYRFIIDGITCETPAEVLDYLIQDRNTKYNGLLTRYEDALFNSVERTSIRLFNRANANFHEELEEELPKLRTAFRNRKESE